MNKPIRVLVVICSTLTAGRSETALKVLEDGAVEIIDKPTLGTRQFFEESKMRICDTVKAAAAANVRLPGANRRVAACCAATKVCIWREGRDAKPLSADKTEVFLRSYMRRQGGGGFIPGIIQ